MDSRTRHRRIASIVAGLALGAQLVVVAPAAHAVTGSLSGPGTPVPAPNGAFASNTCTNAFTNNAPCEGQAGGRTWTYAGMNTSGYTHLYWGPWDSATSTKVPTFSMDGAADGTGESRPMTGATQAGVASNQVRWFGTARVFLCGSGTCVSTTKNTRFTLTVNRNSDNAPIPFVSGPSVGLPATVPFVVPVSADFKANFLFEVEDPANTWTPAVTWYNNAPTPAPSSSSPKGTVTSFQGSWYWNRVPTAANVNASTNEDTPVSVLLGGTDPDGNPIERQIVSGPSHGTLGSITGNAVTYAPNPNYNGPDSFTYRVTDGFGISNTATVSLSVAAVNDAPSATPQSVSVDEDAWTEFTLGGTDLEDDSLTFEVVTQPSFGSLDTTSLPTVRYTPGADYNGPDAFTFRAHDGIAFGAPATVSIDVLPVNDAPQAFDQLTGTPEDVAVEISLVGTDIDGDPLSYVVVDGPSNGGLSGSGETLTYTPDPDFNGFDSFTFLVNDGLLDSNVATVTVEVPPVNDAPVAQEAQLTTDEDTDLSIELIATDVDNINDQLTYEVIDQPSFGSLSGDGANLIYTPGANFNGTDTFSFRANDGEYDSNVATVTIDVTPVNDAPVADGQPSVGTLEDTAIGITLTGSDLDGDTITYTVVDGPALGTLSGDAPNLVYTPDANVYGEDSFTFLVNDGALDSELATVTITVESVNDQPVALPAALETGEDVPLDILLAGTDIEDDPLSFTIVDGTSNGVLEGEGAALVYTPASDFHGTDGFTFAVDDGGLTSEPVTVSITVIPENDAPVAFDDTASTPQYESVTIEVLPNDGDVDGDIPFVASATNGAAGSTTVNEDGTVTYVPSPSFKDSDVFTYTIEDGNGASATATVTVTEIPCNEDGPASTVIDETVEPLVGGADPDAAATLHANNCAYVGPAEDVPPSPAAPGLPGGFLD